MIRYPSVAASMLLILGIAMPGASAWADFEVDGPDGRRILLKEDGTWAYVDAGGKEQVKEKPKKSGEAVLTLERRTEVGPNCRFEFQLVNNLPYEIRHIVPSFSVFRPDGILYETRTAGFYSMKPGNIQNRSVTFQGITCQQIDRVRVSGGDRCEVGELDRFSPEKGECLARVRVVASDLVRFEKVK